MCLSKKAMTNFEIQTCEIHCRYEKSNKSIIEEAEPYNEENKMQPNDIDKLTGIPYARLIIYKKTLPEYLLKLKEPESCAISCFLFILAPV